MTIADLQKYLRALAEAIGAAKGVGKELGQAADALTPFGGQTVADLAKFLKMAEEVYRETGALPVVRPKPPPPPKVAKPPKVTAEQLAETLRGIRRRLADNEPMTREGVKAELAKYVTLTKTALAKVVKELGYQQKAESNAEAIDWITERLTAGKIAGARAGV